MNINNIGIRAYIIGYFQSEQYFENIRHILLQEFTIKGDVSNYTKKIANIINTSHKSTVSLHIRRGDYIFNKQSNDVHGACSLDYYEKATDLMTEKFKDIHYFIFSDDIAWAKENLKVKNCIYIESEEKRIPHEDIYLMSLCEHNIIANSSFSWWGAWLNRNSKKTIIAPKRWFADSKMAAQSGSIVPPEWVKL